MLIKKITLFVCAMALGTLCLGKPQPTWHNISATTARATQVALVASDATSFDITLTPEAGNTGKASTQLVQTLDKPYPAKQQMRFKARAVGNAPITLTLLVTAKKDGKVVPFNGPAIQVKNGDFQEIRVNLDSTFGMDPAQEYHLWQIKPSIRLTKVTAGESATLEVRDFAIEAAVQPPTITKAAPAAKKNRQRSAWAAIPPGKNAKTTVKLEAFSNQEFNLTITPDADNTSKASVQLAYTEDKPHHSQQKIYFRARVVGGEEVTVHYVLSTKENGKVQTHWGPRFTISGKNFTRHLLPLDATFALGDREYHLWQFKPIISVTNVKPGKPVTLEIRDFQIDTAENLGSSSSKPVVTVFPPERPTVTPKANALRVFFHLDNEDDVPVSAKGITDPIPYRGYREMLLSTVAEDAVLATSPEEADVIVTSTAQGDSAMAARIAAAVRRGTPLYAAGNVADPEILALLPAKIAVRTQQQLPQRLNVRAVGAVKKTFPVNHDIRYGVYRDLTPAANATTLLEYSNGAPLMVQGNAGKGTVIYNSLGLGTGLLPETAAVDPLLLQVLGHLTGKKLPVVPRRKPEMRDGWQEGASANNVGRFGFVFGDGLLCETISNALTVNTGSGEYEFQSEVTPRLRISKWHLKPISGTPQEKEQDMEWNYTYWQIGQVELTATVEIPEKWQGRTLIFRVENGIDDTAQVYFNDQFLGEVTDKMPEYWCRPHRYTLPANAIRFGKANTIRVLTTNLRGGGGFGSCPEIVPAGIRAPQMEAKVDRINPLGKGATVAQKGKATSHRFDTSLAFPGIRWEFFGDNITFAISNVAQRVGIFRNGQCQIIDPAKLASGQLPTDWDKPALLLLPQEKGVPLMLVFSKRPDAITVDCASGEITALNISRKGGIGMILPTWINGRSPITVGKSVPEKLLQQADFWLPKAFYFPAAYREWFKLDYAAKRVLIRTEYTGLETANDWGITPQPFAPVSPLAYFHNGTIFQSAQTTNWNLPTRFGWLAGNSKSNSVEWSLPLPQSEVPLVPGIDAPEMNNTMLNSIYADATQFIGGRRPVATANFIHTFKPDRPERNITLHMWLHGISDTITAPFGLNKENFANLQSRLAYRLLLPVEQYGYKSATVWREEPYSGMRFPVCYNSPRPHYTNFAPGKGSAFVICDGNETVYMITTVAVAAAEQHGQRDFIRANAKWFRDFTQLIFLGDDAVTLTGHCGESGQSAGIDMLNCEYPGMLNVARLAEIIGDNQWKEQCLYRAARRIIAVTARFNFKHYLTETGQAQFNTKAVYGTGFNESSFEYRIGHTNRTNMSYIMYDMSQGIPQRLIHLYRQFIPSEEQEYITNFVVPVLYDKDGNYRQDHKIAHIAALSTTLNRQQKLQILQKCLENSKLIRNLRADYPGIGVPSNYAMAMDHIDGRIRLADVQDLTIKHFTYNPATKTLTADVHTGSNPRMLFHSDLPVASPKVQRGEDGRFLLPLKPNQHYPALTIKLQ